ncbi:MAG: hypothetical protein AAFX06_32985 [Planctomycetota bacterium]
MDPYEKLISQLESAPGREQLQLLEELSRVADARNDADMSFRSRFEVCRMACAEGYPEKAIVAFSWCLARFDKDPELYDWHQILWRYKTILELIPVFGRISRDKIIEMQEDMARRLMKVGETERTAHYYRSWNFMRMGDYEKALGFQETYLSMSRSQLSDCLACERDRQVELLGRMKRDEEALELAAPIMKGTMTCGEVPGFTNAHIVQSLLRLGRVDEALERQESGYEAVRQDRKFLGTVGDLQLVLIRVRDFETAVPRMLRHLPWAIETVADELRFRYFNSCALLMETLAAEHPKPRKMRFPRDIGCWREDETYAPEALASWFANETRQLADLFNQRNQNDRYDEMIAETRTLVELS